jgi:hypothetical protein
MLCGIPFCPLKSHRVRVNTSWFYIFNLMLKLCFLLQLDGRDRVHPALPPFEGKTLLPKMAAVSGMVKPSWEFR